MNALSSWASVSDYLLAFSSFYPTIAAWSLKVREAIPSGQRSVLALISPDDAVVALAITKNASYSKLCHFSVVNHARSAGLGLSLMRAAISEMTTRGAHRIHVTTSEEVACSHGAFFERVGFSLHSSQSGRYRCGVDELKWVALRETLVKALSLQIPVKPRKQTTQPTSGPMLARLHWVPSIQSLEWVPIINTEHDRVVNGGCGPDGAGVGRADGPAGDRAEVGPPSASGRLRRAWVR